MNKIENVDKHLAVAPTITEQDVVWYPATDPRFHLYGLLLEETYQRLPTAVAHAVSPAVETLYRNTAGGRLRFATDSEYVAIRCHWPCMNLFPHFPLTCTSGFDLYETRNGQSQFLRSFLPPTKDADAGYESLTHLLSHEMRDLTLNFPPYNNIQALEIGLEPGAVIADPSAYRLEKPLVFYGSSITQGACPSRPGCAYASIVSRELGLDHTNLGFSGSAHCEQAMMDYIAGLPMCAFLYDYDHNAPSTEYLAQTHFHGYKTVRQAQPDIPILCLSAPVVSATNWGGAPYDLRRRDIVRATVEKARAMGDRNIRFIDGTHIFDGPGREDCTVDTIHPNDLGFRRMAQAVIPVLKEMLNLD